MDFSDGLKDLAEKISNYQSQINTEEATKTAFIMPFFDLLGYDTRNPLEFVPEFTADVATKKGEKVDYAIIIDDQPQILIEAKWCGEKLDKHDHQLMRYFSVTRAKIGILTNGIIYKFYTDLEEVNKMDKKPFLEIDLLNLRDNDIPELKKFFKENFNIESILSTAEVLKYSNAINRLISSQFKQPDEHFIDYILGQVYEGRRTQNVKEKFQDIIKKSISQVINDIVRNKLENALEAKEEVAPTAEKVEEIEIEESLTTEDRIETTEEELSGYYIVKSIFAEFTDSERITYKDTISYFGILLEDNTRNWLCRLSFNYSQNHIVFPVYNDEGKRVSKEKFPLDSIEEIYNYKDKFKEILDKLDG